MLDFCLVFSSLEPEFQSVTHGHLKVTAAKIAFDLHMPNKPLGGEYEVQQSTSCWFLYYLDQEVVIDALQKPLELLVSCYVVPPAGRDRDQGL